MKTLICGDLHTKYDIFLKVQEKDKKENFDKIIFLGDYVDDWGNPAEVSYNLLNSLIQWKLKYWNKIVLLLGNHDLSEWLGGEFECSGYNKYTSSLVRPLFEKYKDLFQIAYVDEIFLYTHAGVTSGWLKDTHFYGEVMTKDMIAFALNQVYFNFCTGKTPSKPLTIFASAGPARGGWHNPSPLWADKSELLSDYIGGIHQIVGHTPQKSTNMVKVDKDMLLWFCDTHSTYPDGEKIGNDKFLTIRR